MNMKNVSETIFALSSGALPAGVAVIRLSGPAALQAGAQLAGRLPAPRQAALRVIRDRDGTDIDQGIVLVFPAPASFTGEDCVELQVHGSRAVVNAICDRLRVLGCRQAEAGEFARRAFEHGKMDLVELEGLGDLLVAETEMQRKLAASQGFGERSSLYNHWRARILQARAMIEAELDFSDEEDIPGSVSDAFLTDMLRLAGEIGEHLLHARAGEIIRDGYNVVILGPPNSGKSSLINYLSGRDLAIVTNIAGTTRDVISCDVDLGGYLVRFSDTAGLRKSEDPVERIGIDRARTRAAAADLILFLHDDPLAPAAAEILAGIERPVIAVLSKSDLCNPDRLNGFLAISTVTGCGITELKEQILRHVQSAAGHG
jgi:tRNA modification GTPase